MGNPAFVLVLKSSRFTCLRGHVYCARMSGEETHNGRSDRLCKDLRGNLGVGMSLHGTFRKSDDIVSRNIAGETIIVPIRGKLADMQRIFVVSSVAEYIWQNLDGKKSLDEICDTIVVDFDVNKDQANADLQEFVGQLLEAGLVAERP